MHIDGACHCGRIRFEAEVDPAQVSVCHCTDCQTLSGTAFRVSVPAGREDFRLLSGEPKRYVKVAESGNRRVQGFCAECGTPIYATNEGKAEVYNLRVGAIRQRAELPPLLQIWHRSAQNWVDGLGAVKTLEKQAVPKQA
jgi:hypothetical protein